MFYIFGQLIANNFLYSILFDIPPLVQLCIHHFSISPLYLHQSSSVSIISLLVHCTSISPALYPLFLYYSLYLHQFTLRPSCIAVLYFIVSNSPVLYPLHLCQSIISPLVQCISSLYHYYHYSHYIHHVLEKTNHLESLIGYYTKSCSCIDTKWLPVQNGIQ